MKNIHHYLFGLVCCLTILLPSQLFAADSLVSTGAVWKYLDTGINQGTVWREPAFDDTAWSSGPAQLGFGDGDEATLINRFANGATNITVYFRKTFSVKQHSIYSNLNVRLLRDDGGVVYINGVEVFRSNINPVSPILYSTFAGPLPADGANENTYFTKVIPASVLVDGENLIAVEIHQVNLASTDMSFNLE